MVIFSFLFLIFKEYAPTIFYHLRKSYKKRLGENFDASFSSNVEIFYNNFSEGKSGKFFKTIFLNLGSFFCQSMDGRFFIKNLSKSELKTLLKILPNYFDYVTQNENTFLPLIIGW